MEDNLKGSSVPYEQPVLSAMDHLHFSVASQLFREGMLEQPLAYDQAFIDVFYRGLLKVDIPVFPQCAFRSLESCYLGVGF